MKNNSYFLLAATLLIAFIFRLHGFNSPIADWHSWRQADTSAVSRNFIKHGFDLLHPKFDDLSNVASGKNNPEGYRFVEFPLYNLAQAGLFKIFGYFTLEEWGRLVSIFSSLATILFIYLLVKKYTDFLTANFAAFLYAVLPYSVYYGRTILPDQTMIMFVMATVYFFEQWITFDKNILSKKILYFSISLLCMSSAILLKPYAIFFFIPIIYLSYKTYGFKMFIKPSLWVMLTASLIPFVLWRYWMSFFPEGIPANIWLLNGGNIRFKGAFFYWIFADRIGRLILGYWGTVLLAVGLLYNSTLKFEQRYKITHVGLFYSFLASSLLYLSVIARGNVQHDYYQILIIPTLVIFLALGTKGLLELSKNFAHRIASYSVLLLCVSSMLLFSWYFVRDYFNINNPAIVAAGHAVDELTPENAKVIAPLDGDTAFLYQTNRSGWPALQEDLPGLITLGADYLVMVHPTKTDRELGKKYKVIKDDKDFILFKLRK